MKARRLLVVVVLILAGILGAAWIFGPRPPAPTDFDAFDPEVAALYRQQIRRVRLSFGAVGPMDRLGQMYHVNGQTDLAIDCYERANAREATDAARWYRLGRLHAGAGQSPSAVTALMQARNHDHQSLALRWHLGNELLGLGRGDEAMTIFEEAFSIDPGSPVGPVGLAMVELERGDLKAAEAIIGTELTDPDIAGFRAHLESRIARRRGDVDRAARLMRQASTVLHVRDPWSEVLGEHLVGTTAKRKFAEQMVGAGRAEVALPLLEELHRAHPEDPRIETFLGLAQLMSDQLDIGTRTLEGVLERQPGDHRTRANLAQFHLDAAARGRGDLNLALRQAEEAARQEPAFGIYLDLQGRILEAKGRRADAIARFMQAYERDARDVMPLVRAGRLQCAAAQFEAAEETFRQGHAADPLGFEPLFGLAVALLGQQRVDEASESLERTRDTVGFDRQRYVVLKRQIDDARTARATP